MRERCHNPILQFFLAKFNKMAASMAATQQRLALGAKQATFGPAVAPRSAKANASAKRFNGLVAEAMSSCIPVVSSSRR